MDYEKKYRDLVEAVKKLQEANPSDEGIQNWVNDNVPELKESEDERTRKDIIHFVQSRLAGFPECERFVAWLEKQGDNPADVGLAELGKIWEEEQLQVEGFDAELNALLKKYEHLSKKELQEPLEFYLDVIKNDLDVVREEKPKWSEEDDNILKAITYTVRNSGYKQCIGVTNEKMRAWLKTLKQRML